MEHDFIHFDSDALRILVRFSNKPSLVIGPRDVEISYFSGGPGGQNVNKNMSGVRVLYRIPAYYQRPGRPTELIATSIEQRQREQNLGHAMASLSQKLRAYFYVKPKRHKTKVPRRAKEKRLSGKRILSLKKQARGRAME